MPCPRLLVTPLDGIKPHFHKKGIAEHISALETDPFARCKMGSHRHVPLTDGERDETDSDILLRIQALERRVRRLRSPHDVADVQTVTFVRDDPLPAT